MQDNNMIKQKKLSLTLGSFIFLFLITISQLSNCVISDNNSFNHEIILSKHDFSDWGWSDVEVLSTDVYANSASPRIVVDKNFNVHVVWYDYADYNGAGTDWDVFYRRYNVASGSWNTVEVISEGCSDDASFPVVAVDDNLDVHVVWSDESDFFGEGTDNDIFYRKYSNALSGWEPIQLVSTDTTLGAYSMDIDCDSLGQPHVTWYDYTDYAGSGTDLDIFYKYWNETSSSWTTTEVISTESSNNSVLPSIAIDSLDQPHIVWEDWGLNKDIFYKYYSKADDAWTSYQIVRTSHTGDSRSPSIFIDDLDVPHVVWFDSSPIGYSGWDVCYKYYDFANYSWSPLELVSSTSTASSWDPKLGVDSQGNKYVVWDESTNIYYNRWDSKFSSWTTQKLISNPGTGGKECPDLFIDSADAVHFVWQDYDQTYGSGSDYDIFYKLLDSPPEAPVLSYILPNPTDQSSSILIDWDDVFRAEQYKVYRSDTFIWSVEEMTALTAIPASSSSFVDGVTAEGYYFYVVVAENFAGQSEISNCLYVEIKFASLWEFGAVSSVIIAAVIVFSASRISQKKRKD